jgi:hypothetical protein
LTNYGRFRDWYTKLEGIKVFANAKVTEPTQNDVWPYEFFATDSIALQLLFEHLES